MALQVLLLIDLIDVLRGILFKLFNFTLLFVFQHSIRTEESSLKKHLYNKAHYSNKVNIGHRERLVLKPTAMT